MSTNSTIITPEHLKQVNDALAKVAVAERELEMAKRAGFTTGANGQKLTDLETQLTDLKDRLLKVKNVYFPGG